MARLIDAADRLSHRTMLMVLYSTGMRNAELRHPQVADIDSRRMLIHIQRGKGGRTTMTRGMSGMSFQRTRSWRRVIPSGSPTRSELEAALPRSRPRLRGSGISRRSDLFAEVLTLRQLPERRWPHDTRISIPRRSAHALFDGLGLAHVP